MKMTTFLLCLIMLISCQRGVDKSRTPIVAAVPVDPNRNDDMARSDFFDSFELINLETKKESLFSTANKVIWAMNRFYVFAENESAVLCFSEKGNFLFKIQRQGKGPGEYIDVYDFDINKFEDNNIELLDPRGDIYIFDYNGSFLRKESLPQDIRSVNFFKNTDADNQVFFSAHSPDKLIFYSRNEKRITNWSHPVPEYIISKTFLNPYSSPFVETAAGLIFYEPYTNHVYKVLERSIAHYRTWDFGKHNFFMDSIPQNEALEYYVQHVWQNHNLVRNLMDYIETEDKVYITFLFGGLVKYLVHDKNTAESKVFSEFTDGTRPWRIPFQFENSVVVVAIPPENLPLYIDKEQLDDINLKNYNKVHLEDNPVLVRYKLR